MTLTVYGVLGSQPVRAVVWLLTQKGIAHELVQTMPGSKSEDKPLGSKSATYRKIVPHGKVPAIRDSESGMVLWESNAILCYLADKYDMSDVYPSDLAKRAQVHQWLHWHHDNSRQFTIALFAPILRPDIKFSPEDLEAKTAQVHGVAKQLNRHLATSPFLAGDSITIADIAAYEDIGQCQEQYCNLFDFGPYEHLRRWMAAVEKLPKFEETHVKTMRMLRKIIDRSRGSGASL